MIVLVGLESDDYLFFARKLFMLLSAPLIELLWITIHGVIQLAVTATEKLMLRQPHSHVHVTNIMINLC